MVVLRPVLFPNRSGAYDFLDQSQRLPCTDVGLVRMPVFGLANDVNFIIKALHWCVLWETARHQPARSLQMVLIPPDPETLGTVSTYADVHHPWHWLPRELSLSDIFHVSSCQQQLLRDNATWLQQVAVGGLTSRLRHAVGFRTTIVAPPTTSTGRCGWGSLPRRFSAS
jgi:hypothetical protein